jgi:hypothetical protein
LRRRGAITDKIAKGGTSGWEEIMAKARKKARKAAKRPAKKSRRATKTMAKSKTRRKARKVAKPKARRVKAKAVKTKRAAPKEGAIMGAIHVVTDTIREAGALRSRLVGHDSFEDD